MIYVGIDWAEEIHAICVLDETGQVVASQQIPDTIGGSRELQRLLARHASRPTEIVIGIETDHGLLVRALRSAGYRLYAINPLSVSRYRLRTQPSGAKSDPGDARLLADIVRLDRQHHRELAGDSTEVEALQVLTRAHQELIWSRQRHTNQLRSALRQYYPAALVAFDDLDAAEALTILRRAPTPEMGRRLALHDLTRLLRRAGRQRLIEQRATEIHDALRTESLTHPPVLAAAYGNQVTALVTVIATLSQQIAVLEEQLAAQFNAHPDAAIVLSLPGLRTVLGGRVLAEFGDDPTRYPDSRARKCYAGTAPLTRISGKARTVTRRRGGNRRLRDACFLWAANAKRTSPGARAYYWQLRGRQKSHTQATRALANRLVGILHGCLGSHSLYDEATAWPDLAALTHVQEPANRPDNPSKSAGDPHGSRERIPASA